MISFILALLPVVLILLLMVGLRWKASRAGIAGYLSALVIATLFFGAGPRLLGVAQIKALLLALDVLLIVWAAFLHLRVADEAGAIRIIGQRLPQLTRDPGMLALILGFAFASFLQGVGGFGVPVAVVAPLLVGLNFTPLAALVIPSVGHAWSITFGSMGSSFQALMAASGLPGETLAGPAAVMLGLVGVASGLMVVQAAAGFAALRRLWWPAVLLGLVMATAQLMAALAGLFNLAATVGGLSGLVVAVWLAGRQSKPGVLDRSPAAGDKSGLLLALSAYAILVTFTLVIQLAPGVRSALDGFALQIQFPEVTTGPGFRTPAEFGRTIRWFSHGGSILIYASLAAYWVYRRAGWYAEGAGRRILAGTLRGVTSSTISILAMVSMAVVMAHAGMTDTLARSLAGGVDRAFPLVSLWIGALGAFMTGSNTNSNVVFTGLQLRTAQFLGYAAAWILAAQTTGGAVGSIIAPTKIVVGAATAGMAGQEGEVIRRLSGYVLALILIAALLLVLVLPG